MSTDRFQRALALIDAANAQDPRRAEWEGQEHPYEVLYAMRMSAWLEKLAPDAPEHVKLAARAQHLRRWEIPRDRYPSDRKGYLRWRTGLYAFHAERAAEILTEAGYDEPTIGRVGSLLRKRGLKSDPQMQLLEDVICLVFLEFYFADFLKDHGEYEEEKVLNILRKTWAKMTERGRSEALKLKMAPEAGALVEKAVARE